MYWNNSKMSYSINNKSLNILKRESSQSKYQGQAISNHWILSRFPWFNLSGALAMLTSLDVQINNQWFMLGCKDFRRFLKRNERSDS
jgi:hypothetical protein